MHLPGAVCLLPHSSGRAQPPSAAKPGSTVYEDTLEAVPESVAWGERHIDIVHVLVFIAFRAAMVGGAFDYYMGGKRIDFGDIRRPGRCRMGLCAAACGGAAQPILRQHLRL